MVAPSACNLEITPRITFAHESTAPNERDGRAVPRLNIGLEAVQLEPGEGAMQDQLHSVSHKALTSEISKRVVSEKTTLESAADEVVDINNPHELLRGPVHYKKPFMRPRREPLKIRLVRRGIARRRNPTPM
jgi:hypothetical protein